MPHIQLRTVTNDDLLIFFEHQIDPIACEMAAFPSRDLIPFMAHWQRIMHDPLVCTRTILCDGHVAGNIGSYGPATERCIGYWIGRAFWGQGVATSALRDYLEIESIRPLVAFVAKHNAASARVLEKCGFIRSAASETNAIGLDDGIAEIIMILN